MSAAATGDLDEMAAALDRFAEAGVAVLAVHGGDGTVDAVITALRTRSLFTREPALALLSGGTTNMTHADVGLPGAPAAALARLQAAVAAGLTPEQMVARAPIRMTRPDAWPEAAPFYGFFFATAAIPRVIRQTRQRYHRHGLTGRGSEALAIAGSLRRLLSGRVTSDSLLYPQTLRLQCDAAPVREVSSVVLLATTLERLLLGLRPAPPAPGRIGVAGLVHPYRHLGRALPAFLRGRPLPPRAEGQGLWRAQVEMLSVGGEGEATLDGELFPTQLAAPLHLTRAAPVQFVKV